MILHRSGAIELIEQGAIPPENVNTALKALKIIPNGDGWRNLIANLFVWLGGLALAFAAMFFVAYNWQDIGRFAKFGLVEVGIVIAIVIYCKIGLDSAVGKTALLVGTILLGVLLALFGQTYQTGADTWQLFFTWAMLMLPWAIIGRFAAIWIVWVVLINVSIALYYQTFGGVFGFIFASDTALLWLVFIFNTLVLCAWEFSSKFLKWMSERWAVRLLALASGTPITWLFLWVIFDDPGLYYLFVAMVWGLWLAGMYAMYRRVRVDLFMLAGCSLSAITILVTIVGRLMLEYEPLGGLLVMAVLVVALGGAAALFLKKVHQESKA